jgi:transcription elongation factor Elf1
MSFLRARKKQYVYFGTFTCYCCHQSSSFELEAREVGKRIMVRCSYCYRHNDVIVAKEELGNAK